MGQYAGRKDEVDAMTQEYPIVIEECARVLARLLTYYDKGYSEGYLAALAKVAAILDDMKEKLYA